MSLQCHPDEALPRKDTGQPVQLIEMGNGTGQTEHSAAPVCARDRRECCGVKVPCMRLETFADQYTK